jgi:hypothetical protein
VFAPYTALDRLQFVDLGVNLPGCAADLPPGGVLQSR